MSVKIDLHVHSNYSSDSNSKPREILRRAKKIGLGGVAVVDHGTVKGGLKAVKMNSDPDFIVIPGAEINTDIGEIIGYYLTDEIKTRSHMEVLDEMKSQNAIISIPHPFDTFRFNRVREPEKIALGVDAVEVFNSRCIMDRSNKQAQELAEKHGLAATAGSDAHHLDEIGSAGIIIQGIDSRKEILSNKDFFGRRSPLFLHAKASLKRLIPK